jgi:hypothetical protein
VEQGGSSAREHPDHGAVMRLQRSAGNAAVATLLSQEDPHGIQQVLRSGGQSLDAQARGEMETALGADFSDVRVHTGADAQSSARSLAANAYTMGNDVVFGAGQYSPGTESGRETLAHELTHVVQQRSGPVEGTNLGSGVAVSDPGDRFEREAAAVAQEVVHGSGQPAPLAERGSSQGAPVAQRDDAPADGAAPPPPATAAPLANLQINADELPVGGATAPPAPSPAGGQPDPQPGATPIAYQLTWNYLGGRQRNLSGPAGTAPLLQEQLAVAINVAHHKSGASGFEDTYSVQGVFDPMSGAIQGAGLQINEAFVWQASKRLQASMNANAAIGAADAPGGVGLTGAAALQPQLSLSIDDSTQVFVMGQVGVAIQDNAPATGSVAAGAGVTVTF